MANNVVVTVDVEIAPDRDLYGQREALIHLRRDLHDIPATWFCTATAAEQFAEELKALIAAGHSLGLHGLDHGPWEDYRRLDAPSCHDAISRAADRVAAAIGVYPRVFRGPRMTTSSITQDVLEKLGFLADFSCCARRCDFLTASAFERGWIGVPNQPYHPAHGDPFRRGERELRAIPLSGLAVPYTSGIAYLLGKKATRLISRLLVSRTWRRGAPLVYLFHSYEFARMTRPDRRPWHQRLYPADPAALYEANLALLRWLIDEQRGMPRTADYLLADKVELR